MTEQYKVLLGGKSAHGGTLGWSLPTQDGDDWQPGAWHTVPGRIDVCERGLHLTSDPTQWMRCGCEVYLAEGRGEHQSRGDKTAYAEARLLRPAPEMIPQWWRAHERFVAELPRIPWCQPDGDPNPEWRVFTAPTLVAARDAAWAASRDASWAAAWAAAWDASRATAWDASRATAWGAAGDAARDAARDAAGDAGDASRATAWDASRDAACYTQVQHICDGLPLDQQHREYIEARWEVWRKGYCLFGSVSGVLYVYAADWLDGWEEDA